MSRKLAYDICRLAWPVLIAQLAVMAYAVIDTMMAGRFATDDLAAVGIGASIYFSVFVALMGVLLAVSPIVAQLLGAGRYDEIGEQVRQGMWLTLALAIVSILLFRYPEPLLAMSKAPPVVADKVRAYLAIAAWGAPAGLAFRLFASYTTAVSLPRVMMALNLLGLTLKVPLTWVFIIRTPGSAGHGSGGLRAVDHARELDHLHPCLALVRAIACLPPSWRLLAMVLATMGRPVAIDGARRPDRDDLSRGRDRVHIHGAVHRAIGSGQLGRTPDCGQRGGGDVHAALGDGQRGRRARGPGHRRAKVCAGAVDGRHRHRLALVLAAASGTALMLGASAVAAFYTSDASVQAVAATLLVLVAGYHVFDALQAVTVSALRGYKRAVVPLLINAGGLWGVGLAGGYVIGLTDALDLSAVGLATPLGVPGFWAAATAGMLVADVGIMIYFFVESSPQRARARADVERRAAK